MSLLAGTRRSGQTRGRPDAGAPRQSSHPNTVASLAPQPRSLILLSAKNGAQRHHTVPQHVSRLGVKPTSNATAPARRPESIDGDRTARSNVIDSVRAHVRDRQPSVRGSNAAFLSAAQVPPRLQAACRTLSQSPLGSSRMISGSALAIGKHSPSSGQFSVLTKDSSQSAATPRPGCSISPTVGWVSGAS